MTNKISPNFVIVAIIILGAVAIYSADAAGIPKKAISLASRFIESDLPTTTVFTDAANTFNAGSKQTFQANSSTAGFNLAGTSSDPSSLSPGDIWRNTTAGVLKFQGSSTLQTIVTTKSLAQFNTVSGTLASGKSASALMAGSGITFTPQQTGRVKIDFTFECISATKGDGCLVQAAYGTTPAPAANAAATGTTVGLQFDAKSGALVNSSPNTYTIPVIITGLNVGTTYWIDLQYVTDTTNVIATISNAQVTIEEV